MLTAREHMDLAVWLEKASVTHSSNAGFLAGLLPWFLESRVSGKPSGHRGFWESLSNPLQ